MELLKPCRAAATTPAAALRARHTGGSGSSFVRLCGFQTAHSTHPTAHLSSPRHSAALAEDRAPASLPQSRRPENAWPARRPVIRTCQYHPTVRGTGGLTGARADAREPSAAGLQCAPPRAARCVLLPCGRHIVSPGQQAAGRLSLPPPRGANHASLLFPAAGCRARWRWSRLKALERSASPTSMR